MPHMLCMKKWKGKCMVVVCMHVGQKDRPAISAIKTSLTETRYDVVNWNWSKLEQLQETKQCMEDRLLPIYRHLQYSSIVVFLWGGFQIRIASACPFSLRIESWAPCSPWSHSHVRILHAVWAGLGLHLDYHDLAKQLQLSTRRVTWRQTNSINSSCEML